MTIKPGYFGSRNNTGIISYNDLIDKPFIPASQIQSDWNQSNILALDYIKNKPTIPVVNYPVTSVNTKTGTVVLNNVDVGAAATIHSHTISDVTGLQTALDNKITVGASIPYNTLTGTPTIPTNGSFTFVGLSDTDNTVVANGFLRWNSAGTSVSYSTTIPYASLSGAPSLSTVATTGSYNDLINKPTIPVAQVNSDWNSVSGVSQILNKPSLAAVATSGSYVDLTNKPTIPAAQVQSDWNAQQALVLSLINQQFLLQPHRSAKEQISTTLIQESPLT